MIAGLERVLSALFLAILPAAGSSQGAPVNAMCPVLPDEPVDPGITVEHEGLVIGLCCKRCRKEFLEDPTPYAAWIDEQRAGIADAPAAAARVPPAPVVGEEEQPLPEPAPAAAAPVAKEPSAWNRLGRLHPLVVHFPIALLLAGTLAEVLRAAGRSESYAACARFCIASGAATAVLAALLGWAAAAGRGFPGDLERTLLLHRWSGTTTAALAVLAWLLSARSRTSRTAGALYRALLLLAVAGVAASGHLGATLIYGPGYLTR